MSDDVSGILRELTDDKGHCFVVMAYNRHYEVFTSIKAAVEDVLGCACIRGDDIRGSGMELNALLNAALDRAHLVLAEVSNPVPNVVHDVGYCIARKKPILLLAEPETLLPAAFHGLEAIRYEPTADGLAQLSASLRNWLLEHQQQLIHPLQRIPCEAYQGDEPFIFVSYAHKDSEAVFVELRRLHELGFRIWYDEGIDPGNEWPDEVARALDRCSFFVVFISPRSVDSKNVRNEINFALNNDKSFLAVHLEETVLPKGLALRMGDIQAVLKWRMADDRYHRQMEKALPHRLADAVDRVAQSFSPEQSECRSEVKIRLKAIEETIHRWPLNKHASAHFDEVNGGDLAVALMPKYKRWSLAGLIERGWGTDAAIDLYPEFEKLGLGEHDRKDHTRVVDARNAWQRVVSRLGLAHVLVLRHEN